MMHPCIHPSLAVAALLLLGTCSIVDSDYRFLLVLTLLALITHAVRINRQALRGFL